MSCRKARHVAYTSDLHLVKSRKMPGNCDTIFCIQQLEKYVIAYLKHKAIRKHSRRHSSTQGGDLSPNCVNDYICRVFGVQQCRDHA